MTPELTYLMLSALLAGSLWIPFIIGASTEAGDYRGFRRPPKLEQMRPRVQRASRASEQF